MEPGEDRRATQRQRVNRGSRHGETGGVRWHGDTSASLQVGTWTSGRTLRYHPLGFKPRRWAASLRSIQPNFLRLNIEVIASSPRRSSSTILSERETANERKNRNGNDLSAKGAFAAWTRGGIRVRAIAGAGAVGGRSTGGHRHGRSARCGNRDTRDATAISTTHHSPSATAHAPHRSTCTCARRSTSTAIGDPSGLKR
jgi:hypothetical protein